MKAAAKPDVVDSGAPAKSVLKSSPAADNSERAIRIKEILVPVDFSPCSKKALAYAVAFARQFEASVTLLYVVDFQISGADMDVDAPHVRNALRFNAERQLTRLARDTIGRQVMADTLVLTGQPYSEIVGAARSRQVDLIIMATHGFSGISRFFIGSTTERVVRHAPCPVLIVREREHEFV